MYESTNEDNNQKSVVGDVFCDARNNPLINKINYAIYQYEEQEKGINNRLLSKKADLYMAIAIFMLISILEIIFFVLKNQYPLFSAVAMETYITFMIISFRFIKCIYINRKNI